MKKLLIISFLFISLSSFAQEWFPIGAKWTYGHFIRYWTRTDFYPSSVSVEKDTVVLGRQCKKITSTIHPFYYSFRYTNTDSVFYLNKLDTTWELLYDFSAQPGDTIFYPQFDSFDYYGDSILLGYNIVGSVGQIVVNGHVLRTYECSVTHSGGGLSELGEFAPFAIEYISGGDILRYYPVDLGAPYYGHQGLRCYEDSIIGFFKPNNFTLNCDTSYTILVGLKSQIHNSYNIFPNPTKGIINIEVSNKSIQNIEFTIYNLQGRELIKELFESNTQTINIEHLEAGIYIYEIQMGDQVNRDKLIIQR